MNQVLPEPPKPAGNDGGTQSAVPPPPYPVAPPPQVAYNVAQVPAVTVVTAPKIIYKEVPVRQICPHCNADVTSVTDYKVGLLVWIICGVMVFFGLWLFCCLIPFFLKPCKNVHHSCPNCKQVLGVYDRLNG